MHIHELRLTVVGSDYLQYKADGRQPPPINCFLDFINKLKELRKMGEYPAYWYNLEIEAIKIILAIETAGEV